MKTLKKLYRINSPSRGEDEMIRYLTAWLTSKKIPFEVDKSGNILVTKGTSETYPCVVAHMDEVQDRRPADYRICQAADVIYGFSASLKGQCGLGADDKNGIWIALKLLQRLPALKVAFFVGEEYGCIGSSAVDMSFFDDCRFVIQCDRRDKGDFIYKASGTLLCEKSFANAMKYKEFGYEACTGLMTDVQILRERGLKVSACNLSCGYYFAHTAQEVTCLSELQHCLKFVENACRTITEVQNARDVTVREFQRESSSFDYLEDIDLGKLR